MALNDFLSKSIKLISLLVLATTKMAFAAEPLDLDGLHGLGSVYHHRIAVDIPPRSYHVYVSVPEGASAEDRLPTVYVLDGGITFPLLAAYSRYLNLGGDIPLTLTVGISYGASNHEGGNRRSTDFTAPSSERDFWGGAEQFRQTLKRQIMPLIESEYRADPARRIVFGQSLGGQFVLDTALQEPDLFLGYIASNPALHRNLEHFTNPDLVQRASGQRPKLLVSIAADDFPRFRGPAIQWKTFWGTRSLPLDLKTVEQPGHNHFSPAPAAFRDGLRWMLKSRGQSQVPESRTATLALDSDPNALPIPQ